MKKYVSNIICCVSAAKKVADMFVSVKIIMCGTPPKVIFPREQRI